MANAIQSILGMLICRVTVSFISIVTSFVWTIIAMNFEEASGVFMLGRRKISHLELHPRHLTMGNTQSLLDSIAQKWSLSASQTTTATLG